MFSLFYLLSLFTSFFKNLAFAVCSVRLGTLTPRWLRGELEAPALAAYRQAMEPSAKPSPIKRVSLLICTLRMN